MKRNVLLASLASTLIYTFQPATANALTIGDPAPKLEVSDWIKGSPIDLTAAKGKNIIVVEFWATWCGPCIESIPHLTKLQKTYADQGVRVLGVSSKDPNNTKEQVETFVRKRGETMSYSVAFDKDAKTDKTWMEASGQSGIPAAFILDRKGRIAWIGHPQDGLDQALADIVAGTYDLELARKTFELQQQMTEALFGGEPTRALELADEHLKLVPDALGPWMAKLMVYDSYEPDSKKALATARGAIEALAKAPKNVAVIAGLLAHSENAKVFGDLPLEAISQAVQAAPADADVRTTQYAVLSHAGRDREALQAAEETLGLLKDNARALSRFALELINPDANHRGNDLALRAADLAIAAEPDQSAHLETKFHVLAAGKQDVQAASRVGRYLVEKVDEAPMLNGLAWTLLTEPPFTGKYNALALAAAQRCHELSGGTNWMFLDTLALAEFESGAVADAISTAKKAIELCPDDFMKEELRATLKRFEAGSK